METGLSTIHTPGYGVFDDGFCFKTLHVKYNIAGR